MSDLVCKIGKISEPTIYFKRYQFISKSESVREMRFCKTAMKLEEKKIFSKQAF